MSATAISKVSGPPGRDGQTPAQARGGLQQPMPATFDPALYLRTLEDGSEYLDARWRLVWFLAKHRKYTISSDLVHLSPRLAVVKVTISLPGGRSAQGLGMAAPHEVYRYVETAQTHALARALALLGFGTESALDFDTGAPADSGVRRDGHHKEEAPEAVAPHEGEGPGEQVRQRPPEPQVTEGLPSWASPSFGRASLEGAEDRAQGKREPSSSEDQSAKGAAGGDPLLCQECQGPVKEGRTRQGKVLSPEEVAEKSRQQTGRTLCPRCLTQHMAGAATPERRQSA